ncbi:hypothetical protein, partial [Eubacterium aggregans]|uniref:hypothetical protein n=1 Tax=Eubacterium aggregans TaxID=81409 RepID=UPI003F3653F4
MEDTVIENDSTGADTANNTPVEAEENQASQEKGIESNVTESVVKTPIISKIEDIIKGENLELGSTEYYTGNKIYSIAVKATGGLTFSEKLDKEGFELSGAFEELTLKRVE